MIWLNVRLGEQTPTTICLEETIFTYSDINMQMDKIRPGCTFVSGLIKLFELS